MSAIVLATDLLKPAQRAFVYALTLAKALRLRLVILHVVKGMTDAKSPVPSDSRYLKPLKTAALLELGRLARLAQEAGVPTEPRLRIGQPAARVIDAISERHAKVLVMGTHGRTGWDRLQLGSTAESVIRKASCPVLTVRGVVAGDAVRSRRHVRLDRLLVATDFSPDADQALQAVSTLARLTQAKVCVVHVAGKEAGRKDGQRKLNVLLEGFRRQGLEVEGVCLLGEPVETILSQAAGWEADVISVGTQGRRGLSRLVLGSVAEGVLRRAGCPVLIVRHASPLIHISRRHARGHSSR